jgi:HEAT repeat protein
MIDNRKFLADIGSSNPDERFSAWRQAGNVSPSVIPGLGQLAGGADPGVARAAAEALTTMVHSVGKDPAAPHRAEVVKGLLALAGGASTPVRVHALRLLSNIAGEDSVPAVAVYLSSPDLREEAIYALERIPGKASIQAVVAAYPSTSADFKPRMLAALGHRQAAEALPLVVEAMRSQDKNIVLAAVLAYGRIGVKPATAPAYPGPDTFTGWQRTGQMDAMLRFADAMVKQGNTADARAIYATALKSAEERWQCAAIVGLAKIGDAEAADAILPWFKSGHRTVRITAQQAWRRISA